jgi:serine/threonine protein kinase
LQADDAESSYRREAEQRRQMEATLGRERAAMEEDRRELHDILDKIRKADERSAELELQIANSERVMSELEARLSESYSLLGTLRPRRAATTTAREEEIDGERYQLQVGAASSSSMRTLRLLGYSELDEATNHFDESARVDGGRGDGGRGKVYRAELRGMAVAVKVLRRDVAVDEARFTREVERISGLKHPNLAAVVGACPEARAVAYELVPGGSLEEHLDLAAAGRRSLPWRARCGIAYGACSALAFLHSATSSAPPRVDVTPASILVVGSSSCKLAGLGTRGLVVVDHGHDHHPVSRPALAYADPTSCYLDEEEEEEEQQQQQQRDADVYSLGVVLLRLATGMPAFLARKAAREAAGGGRAWREVVDACWPAERGREVALLGLRCCATPRRELLEEARGVLEAALVSSAPAPAPSRSSVAVAVSAAEPDDDGAPSYLVCPILKEVMRDPRIAGDGFTYEAEAIEEWLRGGRDTSPMTNLKLPTTELVPNHALRHAIHRWRTEETRRFFS